MTKLLFKLKKNGKTVAYSRFTKSWGWEYSPTSDFAKPFTHYAVAQSGITAHPFVCRDKNGKDVFEGDRVIANKGETIGEHEGIVVYRPKFADYVIVKDDYDVEEGYGNYGLHQKEFELIEDTDALRQN